MKENKFNKIQILNEHKNLYDLLKKINEKYNCNLNMDYLSNQIKFGIKNISYYQYTEEEKSFKDIVYLLQTGEDDEELEVLLDEKRKNYTEEELEQTISYLKECFNKYNSGQYLSREQKVMYTNYNDNIDQKNNLRKLKIHEMIHGITQGVMKDGEILDIYHLFRNLKEYMQKEDFNIEDYTVVSGYATIKLNNKLQATEVKNNTYMEMCVESLAGILLGEENKKEFSNFFVPSEMSAYDWTNKPRDLLITALGSTDFLFDMLKKDKISKFKKLKEDVNNEYNSNIIADFDMLLKGAGSQDEDTSEKAIYKIEEELTNIFIKRLSKTVKLVDEKEQIEFFKETLTLDKFKNIDFEKEIQNNRENFLKNLQEMTNISEEIVSSDNQDRRINEIKENEKELS